MKTAIRSLHFLSAACCATVFFITAAVSAAQDAKLNSAATQYLGMLENFAGFAERHWNEWAKRWALNMEGREPYRQSQRMTGPSHQNHRFGFVGLSGRPLPRCGAAPKPVILRNEEPLTFSEGAGGAELPGARAPRRLRPQKSEVLRSSE